MKFSEIRFGEHSAEVEAAEDPDLLERGYYDHGGWINSATDGKKFLFLGPKGSGKSTTAQRLLQNTSFNFFPQLTDLNSFPFSNFFTAAFQGGTGRERVVPDSWQWLIVLSLLFSIETDQSREPSERFDSLIQGLRKIGFAPAERFEDLLLQTRERKSTLHGPSIDLGGLIGIDATVNTFSYERNSSAQKDIAIHRLIEYATVVLMEQRSTCKHIIMFDGLDRALVGDNTAMTSVASLISTAAKLNQDLRKSSSPCKVLIFCRSELYDHLEVYNSNAIRQSYALELDWYGSQRNIQTSHLINLANLRAGLSLGRSVNIFDEFFDHEIEISGRKRIFAVWLLYHTRNTPRDFLSALKYIQQFTNASEGEKISVAEIVDGLTDYSKAYFINEIRDELRGYMTPEELGHTFQALMNMHNNGFETTQFIEAMLGVAIAEDRAMEILRALFACSAIGNIFKAGDGEMRPVSRHYTRTATFDRHSRVIVHRGLWKAFNYV